MGGFPPAAISLRDSHHVRTRACACVSVCVVQGLRLECPCWVEQDYAAFRQ